MAAKARVGKKVVLGMTIVHAKALRPERASLIGGTESNWLWHEE